MKQEERRNPDVLKEYSFLLRAVATSIPATGMLYLAASQLAPGFTKKDESVNLAICTLVAGLLGMPEADPALTERVLRNLP